MLETNNNRNESKKFNIYEVGCGVGNTIFPILRSNKYNYKFSKNCHSTFIFIFVQRNPDLFVYCCDFSQSAIEILKETKEYDENKCKAFVCDITTIDQDKTFPIEENQIDLIVMIFVLSAIKPEK